MGTTTLGQELNEQNIVPIRIDKEMRLIMFALIYDEFDPTKREKPIISVHKSRKTAEKVQSKRRKKLGLGFLEDHTRIVWLEDRVCTGDTITPDRFDTLSPDEEILEREYDLDSG